MQSARKLKPRFKISTVLEEGRPADKIVETANEGNCDLIIMGHRISGKVKEFFLGSVSKNVANRAQCPALIFQ